MRITLLFTLFLLAFTSASFVSSDTTNEQVDNQVIAVENATESVNINSADAETIAKSLKGVGLKKAQAIVEYRDANGAFTEVEQLLEVKGIGQKTLTKNLDVINL